MPEYVSSLICEHCGGQMGEPKPHYKLPHIMICKCEDCGRHGYANEKRDDS